jgi:hypothetical protein
MNHRPFIHPAAAHASSGQCPSEPHATGQHIATSFVHTGHNSLDVVELVVELPLMYPTGLV